MPNHKKPTAIHLLNGNPSNIKDLGKREAKPAPIQPKHPDWLDDVAVVEWNRLAPTLTRLGLLTEIDYITFATFMQEYSDSIYLRLYIREHGRTFEYTNTKGESNQTTRPEVYMLQKCITNIKAYAIEFGLTASSRGRIIIPGMDDNLDPMEALLSGVK